MVSRNPVDAVRRRFIPTRAELAKLMLAFLLFTPVASFAQPSAQVSVNGDVTSPLVVTAGELRSYPAEQQSSFTQTRGTPGQESRTLVRGVRLAAVIERAGLKSGARNDWKTLVAIVTATDGYRAIFTWPELTNTAVGEGVLLVYERDGQPLDAREGQVALLSTADQRLGPRNVRNVLRVELRQLGP